MYKAQASFQKKKYKKNCTEKYTPKKKPQL